MLLPITYTLPPVAALIMLAGIYYGAQYGGSTTAILVNLPGRDLLGRHLHRRLPDGPAGPRRHRRWRSPPSARSSPARSATLLIALFGPPLADVALKFGSAEYFSLMLMGLICGGRARQRIAAQVAGDGRARPAARHRRHRRQFGDPALHASACRNCPTASASSSLAVGVFAHRRDHHQPRSTRGAQVFTAKVSEPVAHLRRTFEASRSADPARHGHRLVLRRAARRRRRCSRPSAPTCWRRRSPRTRDVRQGRHRGRGGAGSGQQRRRADHVHPDAHARHAGQRGDGADARRADHPGHPARAAGDDGSKAGAVLGADRQHVDRQPDAGGAEPADDRHLGEAAAGALPAAVSRDPGVLLRSASTACNNTRLRRLPDGAVRHSRLHLRQARLSSRRRCCSASCSGR